jgi:hypothetical protein
MVTVIDYDRNSTQQTARSEKQKATFEKSMWTNALSS